MQDLTPTGLSEDGTKLLLVSASGEEFAVPADARLRAALRGDDARTARLENPMESTLRPRDIQARIRAGESLEDVAAAAGTSVDSLVGFATPVLAERAHVAQSAQRASVRRSGDSPAAGRTLGEAADVYFAERGLHEEDVSWDAWRRPDSRWALVAEFAVAGSPRIAEFTHDVPGRFVVAENDHARMLTGELQEPGAAAPPQQSARRLAAVPPAQDELPLGDDAIELVRDPEPAGEDEENTEPIELSESGSDAESGPEADAEAGPDSGTEAEPAKKKGRSSVPSWDEIMFGGSQND